ncbi:MAG: rod shape-determining protein MreC [Chthoniobacterales bacterium]
MPRSRIFILAALVGTALFFSLLHASGLQLAQEKLFTFLSPIFYVNAILKKNIEELTRRRMTLNQLETSNRALILENKKLQAENQVLHGAEEENHQLRKALDYRDHSSFMLLPATVIAHDNSTWWTSVKIDRGSHNGIASDMPVITENGLVGKTSVVTPLVTTVILITDENCSVASKVQGTSDQGICSGLRIPTGELQLGFLNKLANLQEGQKVYTAGVSGGIFPSGIEIGTVKSFHLRELDGQAILDPTADLGNLEHVFVIVGAKE